MSKSNVTINGNEMLLIEKSAVDYALDQIENHRDKMDRRDCDFYDGLARVFLYLDLIDFEKRKCLSEMLLERKLQIDAAG